MTTYSAVHQDSELCVYITGHKRKTLKEKKHQSLGGRVPLEGGAKGPIGLLTPVSMVV